MTEPKSRRSLTSNLLPASPFSSLSSQGMTDLQETQECLACSEDIYCPFTPTIQGPAFSQPLLTENFHVFPLTEHQNFLFFFSLFFSANLRHIRPTGYARCEIVIGLQVKLFLWGHIQDLKILKIWEVGTDNSERFCSKVMLLCIVRVLQTVKVCQEYYPIFPQVSTSADSRKRGLNKFFREEVPSPRQSLFT